MTELQRHILWTYLNVRYGMAIIGALFPIVVWFVGWLDGVSELQGSLSRYYWAVGSGDYLARIWFCGGLFVLASLLYLYKGFRPSENIVLNFAAAFAVGVVVFPTSENPAPDGFGVTLHGLCAGAVFACLAYVVWFRARDTLPELPPNDRPKYRWSYAIIGALMALTPLTAYVLNARFGGKSFVFFVESAGIWAFSLYWFVKSTELKQSGATLKAIYGQIAALPLAAPLVAPRPPAKPLSF